MTSKVTIICRNPGMYRNGVPHPARAVYEPGVWTATQLQNFRDDPAFEVVEGEDLTENVNTLASENSALKAQVADLTSKLAAVTDERDQLLAKQKDVVEHLDKSEAELLGLKETLKTLEAQLQKLQAEGEKPSAKK